jgi:hypothetical protein
MSVNNEYSVMALTSGTIADDLNSVEIRLAVVGPTPLVLTLSRRCLGLIVSGLTEIDSAVQAQIGSTTGHVEIRADEAHAIMAQETAGGEKVALSVRNSMGRLQSFALSVEQSQQLREKKPS